MVFTGFLVEGFIATSSKRRKRADKAAPYRYTTFLSFNGTGKPQLKELGKSIQAREEERSVGKGDFLMAYCAQEHQCMGASHELFLTDMGRMGYFCASSAATVGPGGGASSGTAVFTRKGGSPVGILPGWKTADLSPVEAPGRLSCVWLQNSHFPGRGILVLSMYAVQGEPIFGTRNWALYTRCVEIIKAHGGLFVWTGDFNVDASELRSSGLLERIQGVVLEPQGPTAASGRTIDLFVVHQALVTQVISCEALLAWEAKSHRPIRLRFGSRLVNPVVPCRRLPTQFPRHPPVHPQRLFEANTAMLQHTTDLLQLASDAAPLEVAFDQLVPCIEAELCHRFDKIGDGGGVLDRYMGRNMFIIHHHPQVSPCFNVYGRLALGERGLYQLAALLKQWELLVRCLAREGVSAGRLRHEAQVRKALARPAGALRNFLRGAPEWGIILEHVLETDPSKEGFVMDLARLGAIARGEISKVASGKRAVHCASFWRWADDQLRGGAGALHALCRPGQSCPDKPAPLFGAAPLGTDAGGNVLGGTAAAIRTDTGEGRDETFGFSLQGLDLLEQEVVAWSKVWKRHPGAKAPWRDTRGYPVGDLPPLTPDLLREAARQFPARKGYSGFSARWFLYLGGEVLAVVCQFLMACERLGLWPGALRHAMLHLIPKRDLGKRPIGLVDGFCRLWELARRTLVREWRAEHTRRYDYGGKGRTSSDAVWLQALYNEAAESCDEVAVTVLFDLTKAFESVPLELVWARGVELGFPLGVLRLQTPRAQRGGG